MKNDTWLKIYLFAASVCVLLFGISFAISYVKLETMAQVYIATLPFLFAAIICITAFAFTPGKASARRQKRSFGNTDPKVICLRNRRVNNRECYSLSKIS